MLNGVLIIDKPVGLTSHDVVSRLRRILKTKSIGHTGTLDPFATGVLVMLVGKATRLARFLDKDEKEYEALVRFGFETDTGDRTGSPCSRVSDPGRLTIKDIESVLPEFRGEILQTPPMYSAKKVEGKKLYELARKGIEIERKAAKVNIRNLEIMNGEFTENTGGAEENTRDLKLKVVCSAGTYIRTLAEDIGKQVGTGAHLSELRRTAAGKFSIEKAVSIEQLEGFVSAGKITDISVSMNEALSHLPQIELNDEELAKTRNGIRYPLENETLSADQAVRMVGFDNELAAVGFYNSTYKCVQPKVVLV